MWQLRQYFRTLPPWRKTLGRYLGSISKTWREAAHSTTRRLRELLASPLGPPFEEGLCRILPGPHEEVAPG